MQNALAEAESQAEGFEKERDFYFASKSSSVFELDAPGADWQN
jgi:hypothetical protein